MKAYLVLALLSGSIFLAAEATAGESPGDGMFRKGGRCSQPRFHCLNPLHRDHCEKMWAKKRHRFHRCASSGQKIDPTGGGSGGRQEGQRQEQKHAEGSYQDGGSQTKTAASETKSAIRESGEMKNDWLERALQTHEKKYPESSVSGPRRDDYLHDLNLIQRAREANESSGRSRQPFTFEEAQTARDEDLRNDLEVFADLESIEEADRENLQDLERALTAMRGRERMSAQRGSELAPVESSDREMGSLTGAPVAEASALGLSAVAAAGIMGPGKEVLVENGEGPDGEAGNGGEPVPGSLAGQRVSLREALQRKLASDGASGREGTGRGEAEQVLANFTGELVAGGVSMSAKPSEQELLRDVLGENAAVGKKAFGLAGADTDAFIRERLSELGDEPGSLTQAGVLGVESGTIFKRVKDFFRACPKRGTCEALAAAVKAAATAYHK
jgi:hypothetical protein